MRALLVRALPFAALAILLGCGEPAAIPAPTTPAPARPSPLPEPPAEPASDHEDVKPVDEPLPKYVSPPDAPYVPSTPTTPAHVAGPTPEDEKECKARGGKIQSVCMLGALECVVRYRDGGKRCTDKSECTGHCIYEGPRPIPARGAGVCQRDSNPCGCRAHVVGGQVQPTLCVD